ncbi:MAG TPA: MIP/aquaporin family protein [Galbitalea sp.]|nr:MIP/aquaporin family protein [Galbitalea sp.]
MAASVAVTPEAVIPGRVAHAPLWRRVLAELIGTALLALAVVGSGIAAQHLAGGNSGEELGINAAVTAFALFVIIVVLAPVSGAHLNPVISLVDFVLGRRRWRDVVTYIPAQVVGCIAGTILANVLFAMPAISVSSNNRLSWPHLLSEVVATAGLVLVVFALARSGRERFVAAAVGAYIGAAYFFASSTSFANPAITVGRMFTNSFSGIAPTAGLGFVIAQLVGGTLGLVVVAALFPASRPRSSKVQE